MQAEAKATVSQEKRRERERSDAYSESLVVTGKARQNVSQPREHSLDVPLGHYQICHVRISPVKQESLEKDAAPR